MCLLCYILSVLEPSRTFSVLYDCVTMTMTYVTITLLSKSKIKKKKRNSKNKIKKKKKKKNKIKFIVYNSNTSVVVIKFAIFDSLSYTTKIASFSATNSNLYIRIHQSRLSYFLIFSFILVLFI